MQQKESTHDFTILAWPGIGPQSPALAAHDNVDLTKDAVFMGSQGAGGGEVLDSQALTTGSWTPETEGAGVDDFEALGAEAITMGEQQEEQQAPWDDQAAAVLASFGITPTALTAESQVCTSCAARSITAMTEW